MSGTIDGLPVSVDLYNSGGNNSTTYTRYRVHYPDLGLGLRLSRQTSLTRFARFLGGQDIEVGDTPFDDAFQVQAVDASAVQTFLTPTRRDSLHRLLASYAEVTISDDEMRYQKKGIERDVDTVVSVLRRMVASAQTLTPGRAVRRDRVLERRGDGNLAEAAEEVRAVVHSHPDDLDGLLLEAETLYTAGDREGAASVIDQLSSHMPRDPEVSALRDGLATPRRDLPPPTHLEVNTDPVAISQHLFGTNRLSFETDQLFEGEYIGRKVRWSGTVRRFARHSSDHDFEVGPLTKALIRVATVEHDLYGNTEVDAVVALPVNDEQRLEEGQEVTFTGELVKVDGLIRNLFVAEGRLI